MILDKPTYHVELLADRHDRKLFFCGSEALDRYLSRQASQDARKHIAAVFVLTKRGSQEVIGFYTLSSSAVNAGALPESLLKKLSKYTFLPATLLGRLAVHKRHHGEKLGDLLLIHALRRSLEASKEVASVAVIVDAKSNEASNFYEHYGFIPFSYCLNKLFLPMATVAEIFV